MIPTLALLGLSCLVALEAPRAQGAPPSEERVQAACAALEGAFGEKADPASALEAVRASIGVPSPRVVALLESKGLRTEDPALRAAVVDALGRIPLPEALKALGEALKRDKKALQKDPPGYAALLRAIARHGDPASIGVLTDELFQSPDRTVVTARILGLAQIRTRESVDELMRLMRSSPHRKIEDYMPDFRLALARLTGADKGASQELWGSWYGEHKNDPGVSPEPPELAPELQRRWDLYWGRESAREGKRGEKRGEKRKERE